MKTFFKPFSIAAAIFLFCGSLNSAPSQPGDLQHISNTTNSITWIWQDNSDNEQGFRCYGWTWDDSLKRYVRTNEPLWSVNANITSFIESGLAPNTQYGRLIVAWNNDFIGESPYASYDSSRNQYKKPVLF